MLAQAAKVKLANTMHQAIKNYAQVCRNGGRAGEAKGIPEADNTLKSGLVLVHEALLFKAVTAVSGAKPACQRAMLMISKRDISAELQPRLYEMGRTVSGS